MKTSGHCIVCDMPRIANLDEYFATHIVGVCDEHLVLEHAMVLCFGCRLYYGCDDFLASVLTGSQSFTRDSTVTQGLLIITRNSCLQCSSGKEDESNDVWVHKVVGTTFATTQHPQKPS